MRQIPGLTSLPSTLRNKKVHEDKIFGRQDILQIFSGVSKDYKYVKSPYTIYIDTLTNNSTFGSGYLWFVFQRTIFRLSTFPNTSGDIEVLF